MLQKRVWFSVYLLVHFWVCIQIHSNELGCISDFKFQTWFLDKMTAIITTETVLLFDSNWSEYCWLLRVLLHIWMLGVVRMGACLDHAKYGLKHHRQHAYCKSFMAVLLQGGSILSVVLLWRHINWPPVKKSIMTYSTYHYIYSHFLNAHLLSVKGIISLILQDNGRS